VNNQTALPPLEERSTTALADERSAPQAAGKCRHCGQPLRVTFVDLGMSPLCEFYPTAEQTRKMEPYFPLHVYVCEGCLLTQLEEYETPENIFTEYAYFSSYSDTWLQHARQYAEAMIQRFGLTAAQRVVEVASNDGYLLQYFVQQGIPVLGIEPAANVATVAQQKGVPTLVRFFGDTLAQELKDGGVQADLIAGNNVLAQVPDLNGFVRGLKILLAPRGVVTLEFPHLLRTIERNEFDTIYHEHFSYFSFYTVSRILETHGLRVFDVDELATHGGSLRIYACHAADETKRVGPRVSKVLTDEVQAGLTDVAGYASFARKAQETKWALVEFLLKARREGRTVAGYGAPGKGTTLLHYCGIGRDLVEYTVDRSAYKQGRFMAGNHIPIYPPDRIQETKPDYVLILPWNLKDEIMAQLSSIREWGGRFVVPIPELKIY
jgi:SAM-dependent methyltransferase